MTYDPNNIFAKILRGDIPCKKIAEGDHFLSFHDIAPRRKIHALIIPKGPYRNVIDFSTNASAEEIHDFYKGLAETARALTLTDKGFRMVANTGHNGDQEVDHYHVHLLGGEVVGPMVS